MHCIERRSARLIENNNKSLITTNVWNGKFDVLAFYRSKNGSKYLKIEQCTRALCTGYMAVSKIIESFDEEYQIQMRFCRIWNSPTHKIYYEIPHTDLFRITFENENINKYRENKELLIKTMIKEYDIQENKYDTIIVYWIENLHRFMVYFINSNKINEIMSYNDFLQGINMAHQLINQI